jgi:hypothetical protein
MRVSPGPGDNAHALPRIRRYTKRTRLYRYLSGSYLSLCCKFRESQWYIYNGPGCTVFIILQIDELLYKDPCSPNQFRVSF